MNARQRRFYRRFEKAAIKKERQRILSTEFFATTRGGFDAWLMAWNAVLKAMDALALFSSIVEGSKVKVLFAHSDPEVFDPIDALERTSFWRRLKLACKIVFYRRGESFTAEPSTYFPRGL